MYYQFYAIFDSCSIVKIIRLDMRASRTISELPVQRPKSSQPLKGSYHKEYRLTDNQSLNSIRSQINHVFKVQNSNKAYEEVKDLTSKMNPSLSKRIDRICIQYGIRANSSDPQTTSQKVDVQVIAKSFIKAKSKNQEKQNERSIMKRAIHNVTNRHFPAPHQEFFNINYASIRKIQKNADQKSTRMGKASHPYIAIYQKSQIEALNSLIQKNRLTLQEVSNHSPIIEVEEWEKQSRQIRRIYTGVKRFRSTTLKNDLKGASKRKMTEFQSPFIT